MAHNGGPARGFSPLMAAWGGAFTEHELSLAVSHIRTLCTDQRWPRGELNLPRPLATAKAFPEDEAVVSTTAQSGSMVTKVPIIQKIRSRRRRTSCDLQALLARTSRTSLIAARLVDSE